MKEKNILYNLSYKLFRNNKKTNYVYNDELDFIIENSIEKANSNIEAKKLSILANNSLESNDKSTEELKENIYYLKNNLNKLLTKKVLLKELLKLNKEKDKNKKRINISSIIASVIAIIGIVLLIIDLLGGNVIFNNIFIEKIIVTLASALFTPIINISYANSYRKMLNTLKKRIVKLNDEELNNNILNNEQELNKQIGITNNGINKTINKISNYECMICTSPAKKEDNSSKRINKSNTKENEFEYINGPYKFVDDEFTNINIKRKNN